MTEKQYKGIAGNFLICDVQKEYAEHLLSILVKRFGMRFQFHFFSNVKKIEQFAEKAEIEILLIAEDCVSEIRGNVKAKKKFILSESMKKEEKQGETTIFRYQSADEILKIIQSGIGEEEAKAAHKPQKKTEEKYDAVQSDFTAPKRKIGIRDEPEESGLIGIYSPIHRIGKTEFALCLGEKISEKVPTLYINMEGYSGNDFYFKGEKNQDLGDLLYYLKQERIDYGLKASLMTGQYKQLDYIMPISNENDLREVTKKEWIYFLDTIMDQCIYKAVIVDIETIEQEEIEKLEEIVKQKVVNYKNSMQIVDNSRKILFMSGKQIHWHANVWYMERFHLAPERVNPCNPVNRLSFYQVENLNNRKLLQEYARYQIGITGLTIGNIRSQQNYVKKFLKYLGPDVCALDVTEKQIGAYFKEIQQQEIQAETVNRQILDITKFYEYLKIKKHIKAIPFHPEYYEQKVYPIHHDRSVDEDIYMEILHKLNLFPEELRLIFLHLWATGLRISEVCTLKGDAYYWDGEDAWIKVYQIKMKADKMIPVPFMLYEVMQQYIKKNHIHANDYVFQAEQGGAYRIGSFVKRFRTQCKKHKIADCEYVFKTHDYRHTLATQFYDDGVPIQTIRDYLGHVAEEMTKQYVDYMPKKIEKANDNYFDKPENNIALTITPKKRRYRHEKG